MTRVAILLIAVLCAAAGAPARAEDVVAGALKISAPWARATPKGASVGGGYMNITNSGAESDRLVGGVSDASKHLEIHEMSMDNGVMKMRPATKGLEIKPGATIEFKPAGYHLMFVGLNKQLQQGQHIAATLQFEKAGKVKVDFPIEGIGAQGPGTAHGMDAMPGMGADRAMPMGH
jgi:hypothetical protein